MKNIKNVVPAISLVFVSSAWLFAQGTTKDRLLTSDSAGPVRLGMTVGEARKAVKPFTLRRTSDGEGIALIAVDNGSDSVMTLFAGEGDSISPIDERATIEQIEVRDSTFHTAQGIHVGMSVRDTERILGKVKEVSTSEIESRRYVRFTDHPKGIVFRVESGSSSGPMTVISILISRPAGIGGQGPSRQLAKFTSYYTGLRKGCRSSGGEQGGHVSTFCKGVGGYQVHYFDSATALAITVETLDRKDSFAITSQALDFPTGNRNLEWRMADGKPFAVILRTNTYETKDGLIAYPAKSTGEFLVIKGLKGFEHIDHKIDADQPGANVKARQLADGGYLR
jgi:hypothetical protein